MRQASSSVQWQGSRSPGRELLLTLERSPLNMAMTKLSGAQASTPAERGSFEDALRGTGAFRAEVFPDLPFATTWGSLWRKIGRCAL